MVDKWAKLVSLILAGILIFSGCTGNGTQKEATAPGENKLTIATSFFPVYVTTINVVKDIPGVQVVNMTKPTTGCLHDYTLTTENMVTLEGADIFVVNGAGMEAFMDKVTEQLSGLKVVEAARGIELLKDDNGEENPHVWVSITNAIQQVKNISGQLSAIDPANASKYGSNAQSYIEKLEAQRDKMHRELDAVKNKNIITFHEAFPYFAKEFGFTIAAVIEREPDTAPTAQELEDTIDIIKESGIKALFAEPQYSSKAADTIALETGAKVYTLDPAVTGEANGDTEAYLKIMDSNLETLKEALK